MDADSTALFCQGNVEQKQTKQTKMNFPTPKPFALCLPTSFPSFASVPLRSFPKKEQAKNGGKKISYFHVFAPIFLPFSLRLAGPSRSNLLFGCGLLRCVLLFKKSLGEISVALARLQTLLPRL
jgi:hypothetical protein